MGKVKQWAEQEREKVENTAHQVLNTLVQKHYEHDNASKIRDEVIVFINNEKIYVKSSICPHFGGPISYNNDEENLYCAWHGLKFSIEGKCLNQKNFKAC